MLCGFKICCPALYHMLSGFKNMLCGFMLFMCATLETFYIFLSRLAGYAITSNCTLPDSGCWFKPNSYLTRRQLFVAVRTPGDWRDPLSLLWATSSEALPSLFRTSWGHSGPPWVHLWVTRWHPLEEPTSQRSRSSRRRIENICLPTSREINIWNLFLSVWSIDFEGSNELSTLSCG